MSEQKKISAREAGIAVLKKAEAMLKKADEDRSKMSGKSGMVRMSTPANQNQTGVHQHGSKGSSGGISEAGSNLRDATHSGGSQQAKYKANTIAAHKQVLNEQKMMPKPNLPEPGMAKEEGEVAHVTKGPIKLAKFVGRMEHKRSMKTAAPAAAAPAAAPAMPAKKPM